MRKAHLYILYLFIFISTALYAQDFKPTLKTLDSIYSFGDEEKVKTLLLQKINLLEHQKVGNPLLQSRHYNLLGEIFHYASDIGKAYEYWTKSFNLIKKTYGFNSVYIAENYSLLARYYNFRIKIDSAFYFVQKSISICNSKKDSLKYIPVQRIYREYAYAGKIYWREHIDYSAGTEKSRVYIDSANYFNKKYFNSDSLFNAQCLHDQGNLYTDLVCHYSSQNEKNKAFLNYKKANDFYDKAISIRKKVLGYKIHQALNIYGASPFKSAIPITALYYNLTKNTVVKNNLAKWIDLEKYSTIVKQNLENNKAHLIPNVDITTIQKHLKTNECFINQYNDGDVYVVYFITKNKAEVIVPLNCMGIKIKVDSMLLSLNKGDAGIYCSNAKLLYETLLKQTIDKLPKGITHLIISPHNILAKVPFDALVLNDCNSYAKADFLINHFQISYALSANLLFNSDSISTIINSISFLAPTFIKHTALPFSKEICTDLKNKYSIEKISSISPLTNNILHLASHAYCNTDESRNSYILLSDSDSLFLPDLYGKPLNYKLAVLSACETAKGKYESGEGTINFNRYLYLAGIKNTITTLWKVDDQSTTDILKSFYKNLSSGETTSQALHDSKLEYIRNRKTTDDINPYYWAGLVYSGNDLVLEKGTTPGYMTIFCVALGILAGLLGLYHLFRKLRA